jgi:hypothetical protein
MTNVWTIRFKTVTQQTLNLRVRIRKIKTTAMSRMTEISTLGDRMALAWKSSSHCKNTFARKNCSICVEINLYN